MTVGERFGRNLVRARKRAGLKQWELARLAGMHNSEIAVIEHGRRVPRIDTFMKLAASLEAPIGDLLEGIEWMPARNKGKGVMRVR